MRTKKLGIALVSILLFSASSAWSQVEQVTALTVSNPAAFIATIDQYQASGEATANSVSLLAHMHDGTAPSTHTVVAIYDDLDTVEETMDNRATSAAWATLVRSVASAATVDSSALAIQRRTWGDDAWEEGGYLAAVLIAAADDKSWVSAMDDWNRANRVRNPGMVRIVRLRGAPASHAVLLASPSYADLISFMEAVEGSDAFAALRQAAEARVVDTTIYRVAKVWTP